MPSLTINSPIVFGLLAASLIGYILYMMIRRRKGERPGHRDTEPEL
jgi:hypothetical protein